jgi:hypothetical protein
LAWHRTSARRYYLVGPDPAAWHTGVANYGRVEFRNVYPGIDLEYYGNARGQLEYDFVVHPGADPARVRLSFAGAQAVRPDGQGGLALDTAAGTLDVQAPALYQDGGPGTAPVAGGFRLAADGTAAFQVGAYDPSRPLVIDPAMFFSTYLGGSQSDGANAVAVDAKGYVYVTGQTYSANFPATVGALQVAEGSPPDAFVTKLQPDGSGLVWSTYLGGQGMDQGMGIAVNGQGNAYVCGVTSSPNFPVTAGAYQTTKTTGSDTNAFLSELNAQGTGLVYSTYFASHSVNPPTSVSANAIALDAAGDAFVTGSGLVPTTAGAYQTTASGVNHAYVAKLNPAGSALLYSTYLAGSGSDTGLALGLDTSGEAYVVGSTTSPNFPTTPGAYQTSAGGNGDAFLTKLNAQGTGLLFSTYLGGSGADQANAVTVDKLGNAYVGGQTGSSNFPTTPGAYQPAVKGSPGDTDGFVAGFDPSGAPRFVTCLRGTAPDQVNAIAVTPAGEPVAAGPTSSTDFPAVQAIQLSSRAKDAFVARLDPTGKRLLFSSTWGGTGDDSATAVALDSESRAVLVGTTTSTDLPTSSAAYQRASGGGQDAFVAELDISPPPPAYVPDAWRGGQPVGTAAGGDGGNPALLGFSPAGVRYADGAVNIQAQDLFSANFGTPWAQGRSWSNAVGSGAHAANGSGVVNPFLPYVELANGTSTLAVVTTGTDARYFDLAGGVYQERFFLGDTLTYHGTAGEYVLTDPTGAQLTFYDFSSSRPPLQRGAFVSYADPYGNVTGVTSWTADG